MPDRKLVELIASLNGVEKRECANFLKSPYFNQREDVLGLWKEMSTPRRSGGGLNDVKKSGKAKASARAKGGRTDNPAARHLQSFLLQQIETFLAQRAAEQLPVLADLHLAPVYRQKGLSKHLAHVFRRAHTRLDQMPRNTAYYHWQYQLEWEKYATAAAPEGRREKNSADVSRAFDTYVCAEKLRLACLMEAHRTVSNVDYDPTFLPELLAFLEKSTLLEVPLVSLYYHCYRALTVEDEADFRDFRALLERPALGLPADERRTFLLLAINYCIRRVNTNEARYVREAFDLYRVGLETGVLLEHNHLGRFAYKNIVSLGIKLEEFDWVEQFIGRYEVLLEEKHRAANRDYNLARLHFARQDFRRAMPLLAQVGESDLLLNLDSRIMLLLMYYETGEWDALDALISSFKILLLRKKKAIGYHHAHYGNTLRYLQKLTRLNHADKKAVAGLREEIGGDKAVIEKEWLLKMLTL